MPNTISIIIPCYNEEKTLEACVQRVEAIADADLALELIIVNDCSKDRSREVAERIRAGRDNVTVLHHEVNRGKGASLRSGIQRATGDFVAIQDADLEYDPMDLKRLVAPLQGGHADVVIGSRFMSTGQHRVLYYWHYMGNRFLTMLSNMMTDLNLTDMETCYKVFRREVIQGIELKEDRFGFEPEVVAKIAQQRLRIYEMGISYYGRTYAEGKKIGMKDGWRALYCVLKYNLHRTPVPVQFLFYLIIGGAAAAVNILVYLILIRFEVRISVAAPLAYVMAAGFNYWLSILILFRHNARWKTSIELLVFSLLVACVCGIDYYLTVSFLGMGLNHFWSKTFPTVIGLFLNFLGRRYLVFPEPGNADWNPQNPPK
jgi:dolichol-phosphate mannosyltransferase